MTAPGRAACIGGGVIGAGWVARLQLNGVDVVIADPDPETPRKVVEVLDNAARANAALTSAPLPAPGRIDFAGSAAEAAEGAELIVESLPERLEVKRAVYAEVETTAAPEAIVAS